MLSQVSNARPGAPSLLWHPAGPESSLRREVDVVHGSEGPAPSVLQLVRGSRKPTHDAMRLRHGWGTQILQVQELALRGEFGAVAAVEEVDQQADDQPDEEGLPRQHFESHHQHDAEDDAEYREDRARAGRGRRGDVPARDSEG